MQNNNQKVITKKHLQKKTLATLFALSLAGCAGDDLTSDFGVTPPPPPVVLEKPAAGQESFSRLHQQGTNWANADNQSVSLRGVNLGNWLSMEIWMFGSDDALGSDIGDQCTLEAKLVERFGEAEKDNLIKTFRDNWLTELDWDKLAEAGFNVVRLPFFYDLIEDDANPMTVKENAWHYLDWAIEQAKQREIYVILDLHGAAGRQGEEHHTGCAGKNDLWESADNIERTKWLWGQIAARYKDEDAVAAYGLLNEPWGTDSETLKDVVIELYEAVRAEDPDHIVVLPGHNIDGISAYGHPQQYDMTNVAFEMHFYPGIFGWGDINYETHRDWLTCGEDGDTGICEWEERMNTLETPFLIGETQTWTGLGDIGGEVTRASFDKYNERNWAVTAWSFKTVSNSGGVGNGKWGYLTNNGDQLLVKAETWSCNDWESHFASACANQAKSVVPNNGNDAKTMYLVIKTGSFNGTDVVYDDIQLTNEATGENILANGGFGSSDNWTEVSVWGDPRVYDFNYQAGPFAGSDSGDALRVTADAGHNSLIYQAVEIEPGASYILSGKFKDLGANGNDMWAEIYLVPEQPQEWVDVDGRVLPNVDLNSSSLDKITQYFASYGEMDYVPNSYVKTSLTSTEPASLFTNVPAKPEAFTINVVDQTVSLTWNAPEGQGLEYQVFRSTNPDSNFSLIATTTETSYSEEIDDKVYFYYVQAVTSTDTGYATTILASGELINVIPGFIEAEEYSSAHPNVQIEPSGDIGGGSNIGHFETDYWVEYRLDVQETAEYQADFRLASAVGNVSFEVLIDGVLIDTITVPETGGWQTYETLSITLPLEQGERLMRLNSIDNQWNLNWIDIYAESSTPISFGVDLAGSGGSTANVATVFDAEKDKDVISLTVLESGNMDNNYVDYTFEATDFSGLSTLVFDVKDTVGSNTTLVRLIDASGAEWSAWTSDATVHNQWQTISLNFEDAANSIDLTQVVEIRLAQWNEGEYLIDELSLLR